MTQTIWSDGAFSNDTWVSSEANDGTDKDVIITLEEWKSGAWGSHNGKLGLALDGGDDIDSVAADLGRFDLVTVNFPNFADGRAFSIARTVADKFGFDGELRARGAYIIDQMPMLQRCGVTSFEISSKAVRAGLERGVWTDIPAYYQHAINDDVVAVDAKRPWLSVKASGEEAEQRDAA